MSSKKTYNMNKEKGIKKPFVKPKKKYPKYIQNKYVLRWLSGVKSLGARLAIIKKYCDFTDKTPDELILEHHQDMLKEPIEQENIAKRQILAFYHYLVGEKNDFNNKMIPNPISRNSAIQYATSKALSFYSRNNIPVHIQRNEFQKTDKGSKDKLWRNGNNKDRITNTEKKEWLRDIYTTLKSLKDKTILLCKISSGLDDIDLFNLTKKDFDNGRHPKFKICSLEGIRQKSQENYHTFFSSEACNRVKLYFNERVSKGETLTEDSWFFVVS